MPQKRTLKRAQQDKRKGKSTSTQAGKFVREEIDNVRSGKHGVRSAKQAIAIGLSKARRSGVKLSAPRSGRYSAAVRIQAKRDLAKGQKSPTKKPSAKRSRAATKALKREPRSTVSTKALSKQAKSSARQRTGAARAASAKKAARTRAANRKK